MPFHIHECFMQSVLFTLGSGDVLETFKMCWTLFYSFVFTIQWTPVRQKLKWYVYERKRTRKTVQREQITSLSCDTLNHVTDTIDHGVLSFHMQSIATMFVFVHWYDLYNLFPFCSCEIKNSDFGLFDFSLSSS